MKKYWQTIVLSIIFIGLLGFVIYTYNQDASEKESNFIFKLDQSKISSIQLKSFEQFEIKKTKDEYGLFVPEQVPAKKDKLQDIVNNASKVEFQTIISKKPSNYKKFGLKNPVIKVTINTNDNSKILYIGDKTPTGNGYYVKEDTKPMVYKISSSTGKIFNKNINDLINKKIFATFNKEKADRVVINYDNWSKIFTKKKDVWYSEGKKLKKEKTNELIDRLRDITIEGLVANNKYKKETNDSFAKLRIYEDQEEVLNVSILRSDDKYYFVKKGVKVPYYISKNLFESKKNKLLEVYSQAVKS